MIEVERVVESELDRLVPLPGARPDWEDVRQRAAGMHDERGRARFHARRIAVIAGLAASVAIAGTAVGVAVTAQSPPPVTEGFSALDDPTLPPLSERPDRPLPLPYDSVRDMFEALGPGPYDGRRVGPGMYLARRGTDLCEVVLEGRSQCTDRLEDGDVWLGGTQRRAYDARTAPFDVDFFGFARDNVSAIRVTLANELPLAIPVNHNAFRATLKNVTFGDIRGIAVVYVDGDVHNINTHAFDPVSGIGAADRPKNPSDAVGKRVQAQLRDDSPPSGGVDQIGGRLADSARLVGTVNGRKVYVVPTQKAGLCVIVAGLAESCSSGLTRSEPVTMVTAWERPGEPGYIYGVALDGVRTVSFSVGGERVDVPVHDNFYVYETEPLDSPPGPGPPTVTFADGGYSWHEP